MWLTWLLGLQKQSWIVCLRDDPQLYNSTGKGRHILLAHPVDAKVLLHKTPLLTAGMYSSQSCSAQRVNKWGKHTRISKLYSLPHHGLGDCNLVHVVSSFKCSLIQEMLLSVLHHIYPNKCCLYTYFTYSYWKWSLGSQHKQYIIDKNILVR